MCRYRRSFKPGRCCGIFLLSIALLPFFFLRWDLFEFIPPLSRMPPPLQREEGEDEKEQEDEEEKAEEEEEEENEEQ